ncbi:MAG: imelysin family protein [Flavobacteriales bacterium]|nr:imelysin family protein [Flavobacteriales bacterium]
MTFKSIFSYLISLLLITGCIKEPEVGGDNLVDSFDRETMLVNLTDNYILPAYADYLDKVIALEEKITEFQSNPTVVKLDSIRDLYFEGIFAWERVAFLHFGPAENIVLREQSNTYPVDTILIQNNIATASYDLGITTNYVAKGWQSLDYLLFKETDLNVSFSNLTNQPEVIDYCLAIIGDLHTNTAYVKSSWDSYQNTFKENNASNANGSAVSEIMNAIISHYESFIRKGKIGIPVGIFNGFTQTPMPNHCEGQYSKLRLQLASETITYFQSFLNGISYDGNSEGLGILDYANYVEATVDGKSLSEVINVQFQKILTVNDLCIEPWSEFVVSNPPISQDIYLEYQKMIPLLKVDLTSALGVIIVYQDNDGD